MSSSKQGLVPHCKPTQSEGSVPLTLLLRFPFSLHTCFFSLSTNFLLIICSPKVTELGHSEAWVGDKTALVQAKPEKTPLNPRCFQQNRINIQGCTWPDREPLSGSGKLCCLFIALFEKSSVHFWWVKKRGFSFQLDTVFFLTSPLS